MPVRRDFALFGWEKDHATCFKKPGCSQGYAKRNRSATDRGVQYIKNSQRGNTWVSAPSDPNGEQVDPTVSHSSPFGECPSTCMPSTNYMNYMYSTPNPITSNENQEFFSFYPTRQNVIFLFGYRRQDHMGADQCHLIFSEDPKAIARLESEERLRIDRQLTRLLKKRNA